MVHILLILVCLLAGILIKKYRLVPNNSYKAINIWLIYIALPAVTFKYLPYITWNSTLLLPIIAPIVVWFGAILWLKIYRRFRPLNQADQSSFQLVTGLSNTSFMGFPLIAAYFGESWIAIGVICDQISFMLLASLGVIVASKAQKKVHSNLKWRYFLIKVITFPPFIAFVLALSIPHVMDLTALNSLFDKLSATISPLALFSIGLQLKFAHIKEVKKYLPAILSYKLLIAPALVLGIALVGNFTGIATQVTIFEMAMASFVSAGIVAEQYDANPQMANVSIGLSIILSLGTTWFWFELIRYLIPVS